VISTRAMRVSILDACLVFSVCSVMVTVDGALSADRVLAQITSKLSQTPAHTWVACLLLRKGVASPTTRAISSVVACAMDATVR
jgi:hypothetical protein